MNKIEPIWDLEFTEIDNLENNKIIENIKELGSVTCELCKNEYNNIFSLETNQAYSCASNYISKENETYILSHYGSKFDLSKFNVKSKALIENLSEVLQKKEVVICDNCIENLIKNNQVEKDKKFEYFNKVFPC